MKKKNNQKIFGLFIRFSIIVLFISFLSIFYGNFNDKTKYEYRINTLDDIKQLSKSDNIEYSKDNYYEFDKLVSIKNNFLNYFITKYEAKCKPNNLKSFFLIQSGDKSGFCYTYGLDYIFNYSVIKSPLLSIIYKNHINEFKNQIESSINSNSSSFYEMELILVKNLLSFSNDYSKELINIKNKKLSSDIFDDSFNEGLKFLNKNPILESDIYTYLNTKNIDKSFEIKVNVIYYLLLIISILLILYLITVSYKDIKNLIKSK